MAYDDLLNQVSQDPMPNLGASVPSSSSPTESAVAQSAYGSSYTAPATIGNQFLYQHEQQFTDIVCTDNCISKFQIGLVWSYLSVINNEVCFFLQKLRLFEKRISFQLAIVSTSF
jgi:hypothetical protein